MGLSAMPTSAVVDSTEVDHPTNRYLFKQMCLKHGIVLGEPISTALRKLHSAVTTPDDEVLRLAEAMETRRVLEIIKAVHSIYLNRGEGAFESAWLLACEEIFYRATGQQWHLDEDETRWNAV